MPYSFHMAKLKLRKGVKVGALSAEHDELLSKVFVDVGHLMALMDGKRPHFLVLGRTGSGKSALLDEIKRKAEHVSQLDPEELSMQYLHNSPVLKTISNWNVSLEVFYKYLWRHVCILELIRMRYGNSAEIPWSISELYNLADIIKPGKKETKKLSIEYLDEYGGDYWIKSETHVKKITEKLTSRLAEDQGIAASLKVGMMNGSLSNQFKSESQVGQEVEAEVINRTQSIVSDYLIAGLNTVVEMLEKHAFIDTKRHYCLVIDDLDTNWMPDDEVYLKLIKSLLHTVLELNKKLKSVKIIIALRENIYHRVFQRSELHDPQREKWADVTIRLQWKKAELVQLVDKRLTEVFRQEFTQDGVTLREILPPITKKNKVDPVDYVLGRTFMRPRDLIEFINLYLEHSDWGNEISWTSLWKAEIDYSEYRLQSVIDEWKDSYYGIHVVFPFLKRVKEKFSYSDFTDSIANEILSNPISEDSHWLRNLTVAFMESKVSLDDIKLEILKSLYVTGIIGIRLLHSHELVFSYENPLGIGREVLSQSGLYVHKMFWSAFGFTARET
jgi:hypothetical protein